MINLGKKNCVRNAVIAMLLVTVMLSNTLTAFAAETVDRPINEDVNVIELNLEDMEVLDGATYMEDVDIEPYATKTYFLNQAGVTSSDLTLQCNIPYACIGNLYLVVGLSYTDGSTGSLPVTFANAYGNLPVDGASRMVISKGTLYGGGYEFKVTGVKKQMSYVVKVYKLD